MTRFQTRQKAVASTFSIDSPIDGNLYCMGATDTLPISGDCVDVSQIWVLVSNGACDPAISLNPYTAGATAVGSGTGAWSGGSLSGSQLGDHCVTVYWLNEGEAEIQHQQVGFTIAESGGPSCYEVQPVQQMASLRAARPSARSAAQSTQSVARLPAGALPRRVRLRFSTSELRLPEPLASLMQGGALRASPLLLEFCPQQSNNRKAAWTCPDAEHGQFWRMEAVPNPAGRWRVSLTMQRVGSAVVQSPLVWSRADLCFRAGGKLKSQAQPPLPPVAVEAAQ